MDSALAIPVIPALTVFTEPEVSTPGDFDDWVPTIRPIVVILGLLAVVTTMAFSLLSTIGSALP